MASTDKSNARELAIALFEATGISKIERVMYLIEDARGTLINGREFHLGAGILEVTCDSSAIKTVGYDFERDTQVMSVEFQSGAVYIYKGVPFLTFYNLISAESVGRYFVKEVRNEFEFEEFKVA